MNTIVLILSIVVSYLLGAVPFGLLFSNLFSHVDVRTVGSGNIGATNVLRAAGKKAAILTLLADALKGFIPVLLVRTFMHDESVMVLAGAAAVLGHNFPVYLKFKGGKGVATSYGVILAVTPWLGLGCLIIWIITAVLFHYSSLSALVSFACYPLLIFLTNSPPPRPFGFLSLFLFGLIYFRHRENIKRLIAGREPKIGNK